jgi:hypothetical protein
MNEPPKVYPNAGAQQLGDRKLTVMTLLESPPPDQPAVEAKRED